MTPIRLLALVILLAACAEREEPYVANLRRRCARVQREFEKATGHSLGKIEILVLSREELTGLVLPAARAALARIENGPRGEALDAEARSIAEGVAPWCEAYVDARGRILFPDPDEEPEGLAGFFLEFVQSSRSSRDARWLDLILLHELVHVHQRRHLERPDFYGSARSRADLLARSAVAEGHAEYISRKIAPALGLAEAYEQFHRHRFEPRSKPKFAFIDEDFRISAEDHAYAYIQGRRFVCAVVERFGEAEAIRRIFEDPPTLAEVSRPEDYARVREDSSWGPIAEDLRRWLRRERGEADLDVIALPMVREVAGDAAGGFREGYRLRVSYVDVVIHVLVADHQAGARALHAGWTRGVERMNGLMVEAEWISDLRESRRLDRWLAECLSSPYSQRARRVVVRDGCVVVDVSCQPDSAIEKSAERLAQRATTFLGDPEWRAAWLRGRKEDLKSTDAGLRLAAVIRHEEFVSDPDWEVRWMGRYCGAADESNSEEARIEQLVAALEDPHPAVVVRALRAFRDLRLWKVPDPLLRKFLGSPEAAIRREAWPLLEFRIVPTEEKPSGRISAAEAVKLIDAAFDDGDLVVRARAADCLSELVQEELGVASLYHKALTNDYGRVRLSALITLSVYGFHFPELVPDLVRLLHEDPSNAAEALGKLADSAEQAIPHLYKALQNPEGRLEVAVAIRMIDGDLEPLFAVVRDSVAEGKPQGIYELIQLGPRARPLLPEVIRALAHEHRWTRKCAAEALGEIGGEQALDALLQRLVAETDKQVLAKIRLALARLARQAESD